MLNVVLIDVMPHQSLKLDLCGQLMQVSLSNIQNLLKNTTFLSPTTYLRSTN